ncbi:MAG TPA: hypothetical protein PL117_12660 [Accumulibacter sp.]|uniref:hypothetical protein n=1 Tax=Accumulibacter sp. TaxID=2053492 RepID=UPI002C683B4D|nr:hypothetical protein [Accumulibacter sp.]HRF73617.1 hypothetical protein [Accumulibacter sp.]
MTSCGFGEAARTMITEPHPPAQKQDSASPPSPWEFVRLADYRVPNPVGATAAFEKWASLKRIFRHPANPEPPPVKAEADLRALPKSRLRHLAGPIDWRCAASALDAALAGWPQSGGSDEAVKFVIGQPHCGHAEILEHWAARHRALLVEAPAVDRILGDHGHWLESWSATDRLWVLPHLEHCYLRHADGLELVRRLLERATSGALGRGVIACDSWAWTYLQRVWPLPQPDALTLQAFDGPRLSRFLAELVAGAGQGRLQFRNATTGKEVRLELAPADGAVSPEINHLAIHSGGNIGTAWSFWRSSLRAAPAQVEDAQEKSGEQAHGAEADADVVWVSTELREPVLPREGGEAMAFLLHGLLLHNGLPEFVLPELQPQPGHRLVACLLELRSLGAVILDGERWRVSASAYGVVREFLRARGFLRDHFLRG